MKFILLHLLAMPLDELERDEPQTGTEMMAIGLMMTASNGSPRASLRATRFITERVEGKVRRSINK